MLRLRFISEKVDLILLNVLCSDQPFVLSEPTNTATEYFLGDALGSTHQLTDPTGTVTLAKSYDPVVYPEPVEGAQ